MNTLKYLSLLLFLGPLASDFTAWQAGGRSEGVESKSSSQPNVCSTDASIEAYLNSESDELRDRATYSSKYSDYVNCLKSIPLRTPKQEAQFQYFQALAARMGAEKLVDTNPDDADAKLVEAMGYINAADAADGANPKPYIINEKGIISEMQGNYQDAVSLYRSVLNVNIGGQPKPWAIAHSNLANVLAAEGKTISAESTYATALREKSDFAAAHLGIGNLLLTQDDPTYSDHLEQAFNWQKDVFEMRYGYARGLMQQGRTNDAINQYNTIVSATNGRGKGKAHYALGYHFESKGHYNDAITEYQKVIESFPGDKAVNKGSYMRFGEAQKKKGNSSAGAQYLRQNKLNPNNPIPEAYAAYVLLNGSGWKGRLNEIKTQLGGNYSTYKIIQDIAVALYRSGHYQSAKDVAEWAIIGNNRFDHIVTAHHTYLDIMLLKPGGPNYNTICNELDDLQTSASALFDNLRCIIINQGNGFYNGLKSNCTNIIWNVTCP
ncbi:tetratricopeptide repeat protein [Neolewinella litorea]|uniref:Tetratricopeptide repeat protein n=1 Tax=Neolewinella litorea TaxID=2562452 RepID=A0A4S4NJ23_9BACT|nr:tetratricopeptide repeat protein [Neolewinella litorea]THH39784.1 tetratricopeptide repeat protein [Neolewinella litorea]